MYDQAGAITASFRDPSNTANPAFARGLTVLNTGMTGTPQQEKSWQTGTGASDASSAIPITGTLTTPTILFPFTTSYSVWAGACDATKPPAADMRSALVPPGGTLTLSPTTAYLKQPKLTVNVKRKTSSTGTATNFAGADVRVRDACNADYPAMPATNSSGNTSSGFPYGALTVCADDNQGSPHWAQGTVTNSATGASINLQINTYQSSQAGSCPQ
jgi:hypothetical protein